MKRFYQIATQGREADIYIFGDITVPSVEVIDKFFGDNSSVSGFSLVNDIKALDVDIINVHINSYGGIVSEGMAIYNALKQHPAKIVTHNDGFCASAAVMPFLAGEERIASSCSAFLFHQVMAHASGNADEMRAVADELDALTALTMEPYMAYATITEAEMKAIFQKGGWLKPQQVKDMGLVTAIETYEQEEGPAASAKGAFFMQFFSQAEPTTIELSIANAATIKQIVDGLKAAMDEKPTEQIAKKTHKFLNALTGRKE